MNDEQKLILETLQKQIDENLSEYIGIPTDVNVIKNVLCDMFENWYPEYEVKNVKYLDDNKIQCDVILYPYMEVNFTIDKDYNIVNNNNKEK